MSISFQHCFIYFIFIYYIKSIPFCFFFFSVCFFLKFLFIYLFFNYILFSRRFCIFHSCFLCFGSLKLEDRIVNPRRRERDLCYLSHLSHLARELFIWSGQVCLPFSFNHLYGGRRRKQNVGVSFLVSDVDCFFFLCRFSDLEREVYDLKPCISLR